MRILFINCNPDLSHYTSKGLVFDTEYKTISQKFPTFKVGTKQTSTGQNYDLYTPDVSDYVDTIKDKYSLVVVGYNPVDYGAEFNGTGGYSCKIPSKTGIFWATVRIDPYVNHYIIHELSHLLCTLVFRRLGKIVGDFMDSVIISGVSIPYYKDNDENAPDGNFAITWKGIQPFISQLNNLDMYKYTLTRNSDDGVQTLGTLTFTLKGMPISFRTLERPWKNNQQGISCIPKGLYDVRWTFSLKLMRYTYEVQNVPNRSGIRLHKGNFFFDVEGCILLGDSYSDINKDGKLDVMNSKVSMDKFEMYMNKEPFKLEIL